MSLERQARLKFEDYLAENGTLTYSNVGRSMMPLLREGRDLFTVERKTNSRCKVGDVVLYRRPPDKYVLHRVIQVRENDYVILGDNCVAKEYGITDGDFLGIMTSFVRDGRERSVKSFSFRLYTFIMLHTISLRIFLKRLICKFKNR